MAFGISSRGDGPSPSSSFSTLSPLAPPFTVDRPRPKPNDSNSSDLIRHFTTKRSPHGSSDPTPATFPNSVIKSETFYPHYQPVGDAGFDGDDYLWNAPYDEGNFSSWEELQGKGVGGSMTAPSWGDEGRVGSKSLSWMEPSPSRFTPNYVGATGQDVAMPEAVLPSENSRHVNHFDAFVVRKPHLRSECNQWLDDKHSIQIQRHPKVSIKRSNTSALSSSVGNHSFPSSSGPFNSMELCGSYTYDGLIACTSSGQKNQMGCQKTTYCSSSYVPFPVKNDTSISVYANTQENPYMHDQHVGGLNGNYQQRPYTLSNLAGLSVARKVEIKPYIVGGGKKSNGLDKTVVLAAPTKDNSVTGSLGNSSNSMPLGRTNLIVQTTSETNDSSQISSEPFDQLNLCEDSPCWKGASFSRNSPFHVNNAPSFDSCLEDKKLESEHQKPDGLVIIAEPEKKSEFLDASGMENDAESSSLSRVCETTIPPKDGSGTSTFNVSCGSINANSNSFPKHPQDNSSSSDTTSRSQISDSSLHDVYHFDKITKESQNSCSKEGSEDSADPHFLVRSLYDLSNFLCGYSYEASILKKEDHELLLTTINNLNACVSKAAEQYAYQANTSCLHSRKPSTSTEVQMPKTEVNSVSRLQSKQTCKSPSKAKSLMYAMNNDDVFDGGNDLKSAMTKEIEKSMKKIFFAEEENPETNLYKIRWIETEAALCSTNCELLLARKKVSAESSAQLLSIEPQLPSISKKESRRETKVAVANPVCDLDENNELVTDAFKVSSHSTSDSAKISTQTLVSGKPEAVDLSNVDFLASVMARYGMMKDRIDNVESQPLKDQNEVQETKYHGARSLEAKQTIPVDLRESEPTAGAQLKTSFFASTSASKSRLLYSRESEDANPELSGGSNVQFIGSNYSKGTCFSDQHFADDIKSHVNVLVGQEAFGEFPADYGNSFFQPYSLKDRYMEGYYATNHDNTSDWEHVGKVV